MGGRGGGGGGVLTHQCGALESRWFKLLNVYMKCVHNIIVMYLEAENRQVWHFSFKREIVGVQKTSKIVKVVGSGMPL